MMTRQYCYHARWYTGLGLTQAVH
ncbi:hypothetical protein ABKN59_010642 [Abortiporus biennis]